MDEAQDPFLQLGYQSEASKNSTCSSIMSNWSSHLSVDISCLEIGPGYFRRTPSPQRRSPNPRSKKMQRSAWKPSSDPDYHFTGHAQTIPDSMRRDHPISLACIAQGTSSTNNDIQPHPVHKKHDTPSNPLLTDTESATRVGIKYLIEATRPRRNSICIPLEDLSLGHGDPFC
jgi:hypothetical protein